MRKNFGAKPWTYPQPVFILAAYDEAGVPNAMNAAWGGISEDKELSMCISEGHKTTANILRSSHSGRHSRCHTGRHPGPHPGRRPSQ